jgi:hypothetical protein
MSKIQISTLHKINSLLAEILKLEESKSRKQQEIESLKLRNADELISFRLKTEEEFVLKQNMALFTITQNSIGASEIKTKFKTAKEIEALIESFFQGSHLSDLIEKIIKANDGDKYIIEADPAIAKSLKLENTSPAKEGVLNVVFGHKKYILNKKSLSESLREKLLVNAFN